MAAQQTDIPQKSIYGFFKRVFDIIASGLALLILSPILLIILLIKFLEDFHSPIYRSVRIGKGGKPFNFYKIRSMRPNADRLEDFLTPEELEEYKKEFKLVKDPRITSVGRFLRKSSMDELPQLWNILRGDMSLVGPRPLLEPELRDHYTPEEQALLVSVRPGLTGYWQAAARNESTYETGERQYQELYYIGRVTLWMDIKILLMTVKRVFSGKGAI